MTPEEELKQLIAAQLADPCTDNLPAVCKVIATPEGKERIAAMVFQYCITQGTSVQTALAFIDSEL